MCSSGHTHPARLRESILNHIPSSVTAPVANFVTSADVRDGGVKRRIPNISDRTFLLVNTHDKAHTSTALLWTTILRIKSSLSFYCISFLVINKSNIQSTNSTPRQAAMKLLLSTAIFALLLPLITSTAVPTINEDHKRTSLQLKSLLNRAPYSPSPFLLNPHFIN